MTRREEYNILCMSQRLYTSSSAAQGVSGTIMLYVVIHIIVIASIQCIASTCHTI